MKQQLYFDIVIIGGGPAGTAAALTLLKYSSFEVAVIEGTNYDNARVGENVSPSLQPVLRYLGVEDILAREEHIPSHGIDAAWGSSKILSRDFLFTGLGNGWHLDRIKFDRTLADKVEKNHGHLFTSTKVLLHEHDKKRNWQLVIKKKSGVKRKIRTKFVIDASGKRASFARALGSKWKIYDKLIGVVGFYKSEDDENIPQRTLVESFSRGWWYLSPLADNKKIVAFMTDSDIAKEIQILKPENWKALLSKTNHIKRYLGREKLIIPLKIFSAHSQIIEQIKFQNWIAAGDAISSFDPLSSMGVGHAMVSGIHAAQVAHGILNSDDFVLTEYLDQVIQNFRKYLRLRKIHYQAEQRWKNEPFWNRRISWSDQIPMIEP
jgi:flavin-dependent dehydrogenase